MAKQNREKWGRLHRNTQLTRERTISSPIIVDYLSRRFALETDTPARQKKALEIGFGIGRNMMYLAEKNYCQYVVGIDMIEEALTKGRLLAQRKGYSDRCNFLHAIAGETFPFEDNSFDFVFDIMSASTFICDDRLRNIYASEVSRVLKKGGVFFVYTGNADGEYFKNLDPQRKIGKTGCFVRSMDKTTEKAYIKKEIINLFSPLEPVVMEAQSRYFRAFGAQDLHRVEGFWFAVFRKGEKASDIEE